MLNQEFIKEANERANRVTKRELGEDNKKVSHELVQWLKKENMTDLELQDRLRSQIETFKGLNKKERAISLNIDTNTVLYNSLSIEEILESLQSNESYLFHFASLNKENNVIQELEYDLDKGFATMIYEYFEEDGFTWEIKHIIANQDVLVLDAKLGLNKTNKSL